MKGDTGALRGAGLLCCSPFPENRNKKTGFVDTINIKLLHDLHFSQNQLNIVCNVKQIIYSLSAGASERTVEQLFL
jgi:hypothetical protein